MHLLRLIAALGLVLITTLGLPAQTVRVIFTSGEASMQRPDETALRPVVKGETVVIGTRLVTGADGRVVLTPMPGVKSIIAPNTTIVLESASETRASPAGVTHQAVLDLKEGAVVSDLQKPEGVTYDYSIRTARGLAGARGTTFTVGINAAGIQTIVVAHGSISVTFLDGRAATLSPGHLSLAKPSGETQSVGNIGELPESDRKIAQNWAETTVLEIAAAVEAGLDISPESLRNALDTAAGLGVTLSPETRAAVEKALSRLGETATLFDRQEQADPLKKVNEETARADTTRTGAELLNDDSGGDHHGPPPPPTPIELFRAQLAPAEVAVFDTLPSDIQQQFVTLGDLGIASVGLAPDRDTGLPYTHDDLRVHLAGFLSLSENALALVKTLAGANLQNFDSTPDPAAWSPAAFERTLASWNALDSAQRDQIVALGAGEAIMDASASYIEALLSSLGSAERALIQQTGWGGRLGEIAGKPGYESVFAEIAQLSSGARDTIKFFNLSPEAFTSYYINAYDLVEYLSALGSADRETIRQLGIVDSIFGGYSGYTSSFVPMDYSFDYESGIQNALAFYAQLSSSEKVAVRAAGLGRLLFDYEPGETVNQGGKTALQYVRELARFYNDNPGLRQAIQETGVLAESDFLYSAAFDADLVRDVLSAYQALPARTRGYLMTENGRFGFYSLYQASQPGYENYYGVVFRTLSEINAILSGLTASEYATLLDLDLGVAVLSSGENYEGVVAYFDGAPLPALKAAIAYYAQLDTMKKFVLRELGILGEGNVAFVGADAGGLSRLLAAYAALPGTLRAATEHLDEYQSYYGAIHGSDHGAVRDHSFFFPRGYDINNTLYNVSFRSTRDLYVGATRYLRLEGYASYYDSDAGQYVDIPTFTVGAGRDLYLHAANLIDLNNVTFSAGIRGITLAAHTLNLANVDFPEGSVVSLNSKLGQLHFGSSWNNGKVNFTNVSYGGSPLNSASDLTAEFGARGNIAIGTLANPAALPSYTPHNAH